MKVQETIKNRNKMEDKKSSEPIDILIRSLKTVQDAIIKLQEQGIEQQKQLLELQDIIHTNAKHINTAFTILKALTEKYPVVLEGNT